MYKMTDVILAKNAPPERDIIAANASTSIIE
jgi:hypothetical protein